MINRIIRYSLEHRLLTVFLVILASILGIFAAVKMPKLAFSGVGRGMLGDQ